ncbi:hypothetical protein NU219Hw_g759t1 [Hortaea werneckii]
MTAIQETQDSRLLSLSPELRNIIYEEVLVATNNINIPKDGKLVRPPLLKVCRQVAEEASTIFYGLNRFKSTNNRLEDLPLWFARLPLKLRRSINAIDLCYETDTDVNIVAHELHAERPLGYRRSDQTPIDIAERRFMSANKKFLDTAFQMALLGLDLNAFRLLPQPPISDSGCDPFQTDLATFTRKTIEDIHRKDEEWLRELAMYTKDENIMVRSREIVSIIQG